MARPSIPTSIRTYVNTIRSDGLASRSAAQVSPRRSGLRPVLWPSCADHHSASAHRALAVCPSSHSISLRLPRCSSAPRPPEIRPRRAHWSSAVFPFWTAIDITLRQDRTPPISSPRTGLLVPPEHPSPFVPVSTVTSARFFLRPTTRVPQLIPPFCAGPLECR